MNIEKSMQQCCLGNVNINLRFWYGGNSGKPDTLIEESFYISSETELIENIFSYIEKTNNLTLKSNIEYSHECFSFEEKCFHYIATDCYNNQVRIILSSNNLEIIEYFKFVEHFFYERQKEKAIKVKEEKEDKICQEYIEFLRKRGYVLIKAIV
jgi:hypothetical protein